MLQSPPDQSVVRTTTAPKQTRHRLWLVLAALVLLGVTVALLDKRPSYHPEIVFQAADLVQVSLIKQPYNTLEHCETAVKKLETAMRSNCPECKYIAARCVSKLSPRQQNLLQGQSTDMPTLRIARGAMGFESVLPDLALQTCQQAAQEAGGMHRCVAAGSTNSRTPLAIASELQLEFKPSLKTLLQLTLFAAAVSFLICAFLIASERWHGRFSHDAVDAGPQKFHTTPVPRIGGIAIACAIALSLLGLEAADLLMTDSVYGFALLALAAVPAFAGGLAEDLTKKVGVLPRLLLTMAAGALASVLAGATLTDLDIPGLNELLQWSPLIAIAFTAFAVAGVANAINIIDGYNGLASGFAILALCAYAWVSHVVGDQVILLASLTMLGGVLGFFIWNWPKGRIFLGDGGAYLLGFWLAELGVLLVVRNADVSPWFPLVIMIYPIWETLFSMYRRKVVLGKETGSPDAEHFHQLIFQALARRALNTQKTTPADQLNSRVAPCLWLGTLPFILTATLSFKDTTYLIGVAAFFAAIYIWLYLKWSSLSPAISPPRNSTPHPSSGDISN